MKASRLRVALLATVVDFGGAARVVLSLIENLRRNDVDFVPIIFTRSDQRNNIFFQRLDKIEIPYHRILVNLFRIKYLNPFANAVETYNLLRKTKCDLIHTHGYRADVLGGVVSKLLGLPVISTCHGFISTDRKLTLYNRLDRMVLRSTKRILAVSEEIKEDLVKSGIQESKIAVVLNAIQIMTDSKKKEQNRQQTRKALKINDETFVVGYVGRLSEEKGIRYLIEASALLVKSSASVKIIVVGDGSQKHELENLTNRKGISSHVVFMGFQAEIESWLAAIDVLVLPSLTEGTPMALLEAMACGVPIIASAVGGVPRIIHSGKNGILVPSGHAEALYNALANLLKDKLLRTSLSEAARKTVIDDHSIDVWTRKIGEQYFLAIN